MESKICNYLIYAFLLIDLICGIATVIWDSKIQPNINDYIFFNDDFNLNSYEIASCIIFLLIAIFSLIMIKTNFATAKVAFVVGVVWTTVLLICSFALVIDSIVIDYSKELYISGQIISADLFGYF